MAGLFDKIKKDVKEGIEEGIAAVKEGATVVSEKVGELTAEGKRQYKMYDLKAKIQKQMTVLGGRAYDVLDCKKNPAADSKVKSVLCKDQETRRAVTQARRGERDKSRCPKEACNESKSDLEKNRAGSSEKDGSESRQKGSC